MKHQHRSLDVLSGSCYDPEFTMSIVDALVEADQTGDPDLTPDDVVKAAHDINAGIKANMDHDVDEAKRLFDKMVQNSTRRRA